MRYLCAQFQFAIMGAFQWQVVPRLGNAQPGEALPYQDAKSQVAWAACEEIVWGSPKSRLAFFAGTCHFQATKMDRQAIKHGK
jgi:hypothetical protein